MHVAPCLKAGARLIRNLDKRKKPTFSPIFKILSHGGGGGGGGECVGGGGGRLLHKTSILCHLKNYLFFFT